jgi:hypothetical protein
MKVKDNQKVIKVNPESPLALALKKMLDHKRLKEQFWSGNITLIELNKFFLEKGINKQYEHETAV